MITKIGEKLKTKTLDLAKERFQIAISFRVFFPQKIRRGKSLKFGSELQRYFLFRSRKKILKDIFWSKEKFPGIIFVALTPIFSYYILKPFLKIPPQKMKSQKQRSKK